MDDDDVSKWEPDAISAPSKRIQNNNILNPEDQDNNKNSNVSKKKL